MRQKGFTLAELLGVLVIIGLLLILIIPGVINRLSNSGDTAQESNTEIIYNLADQYIKEHPDEYPPGKSGKYCVTIKSLIDDGKLVAPVVDLTTGKDISDKSVLVTIYSSGNTDHELKDGDECENISALPFIDFIVTPNGSNWVQKRTVKIIWPAIEGNYRARYRINNGDWVYVDTINSRNGGTIELIFNKSSASTPLEAQYLGTGQESSSNIINSKIDIVNVDSVNPKCTLTLTGTMGDNNWYRSNVTVDFGKNNSNLSDDLSGVADYGISTSTSNTFGKISQKVQKDDIGSITYYGYVIDKAGNIGKCSATFKKDATKPTCTISDSGTKGNNDWYVSNVSIKATNSDNLSQLAGYGLTTSSSANYNGTTSITLTSDTKSITYYGHVKDNAGNTNQCSKTVKRDVTKPTCTVSRSNTYQTNGVNFTYNCSDSTSGTVSCPGAKNYQKGNVASVSIKDNAGNIGTCPAQTVSTQTQYRKRTRTEATCKSAACCGTEPQQQVTGSKCVRWYCSWQTSGGSHPGRYYDYDCKNEYAGDDRYELFDHYCDRYEDIYDTVWVARTCKSSCCGYTSWSGWSGWGTGNYCNDVKCQSESRVVYF